MQKPNTTNRAIRLIKRPAGVPTPDCFRLDEEPIPEAGTGEVLLKTLWLSLDPYMRGRMNDSPSYAPPVALGDTMVGGTVSRVEQSRHAGFSVGELVLSANGWQDYVATDGTGVFKISVKIARPSYALGVLGMPGITAYIGLVELGLPKQGETVVVAAATGAVGSVVGQIAKIKGCRVVGLASGREKCDWAVKGLGFDFCIDRRSPSFAAQLADACPAGIDIYFENVGGVVLAAVLPLLNVGARVPVCGQMSLYNPESEKAPEITAQLMGTLLRKRVNMRGFIVYDYEHRFAEIQAILEAWFERGWITYREDVVDGLENAPEAFIGLLKGANFGKLVLRVDD